MLPRLNSVALVHHLFRNSAEISQSHERSTGNSASIVRESFTVLLPFRNCLTHSSKVFCSSRTINRCMHSIAGAHCKMKFLSESFVLGGKMPDVQARY